MAKATVASWVASHFTKETIGGTTVYDLTKPGTYDAYHELSSCGSAQVREADPGPPGRRAARAGKTSSRSWRRSLASRPQAVLGQRFGGGDGHGRLAGRGDEGSRRRPKYEYAGPSTPAGGAATPPERQRAVAPKAALLSSASSLATVSRDSLCSRPTFSS